MYEGYKIIALCISRASSERNLEFIEALNKSCNENKSKLFIFHSCTDFYHKTRCEEGDKAVFDLLDFDILDAVILFDETFVDKSVADRIVELTKKRNLPLLCIGTQRENAINFIFHYEMGFELVVRHAIEHHKVKNPCFIAGPKGEYSSEKRIEVYKKVLRENNMAFDENRLFYGDYWWMPTRNAIDAILSSGNIPDALICANDNMAIASCEHLRKLGYKIPEDIMITGFDGIREAKCCNPPITTAKCDMNTATNNIVSVIDDILSGKSAEQCYYVPYTLDIYRSCGCQDDNSHIDTGELLKGAEDRFFRYQDDERKFHETSENITECETLNEVAIHIDQSDFYNSCVIVNKDCFDVTINPKSNKRTVSFDEDMTLLYLAHTDISQYPQSFKRKDILPNLHSLITEIDRPVLFNSISFLGIPMGYVCFYFPADTDNYTKIRQFVTALNNIIGTYRTVKYLEYAADSVEQSSVIDHMTGLNNRKGFYKKLPLLIEKAKSQSKHVMVATIDIDGLKYINDNFGHEEGDFAIKSVSNAVSSTAFSDSIIGRFGGDEIVACAICNDEEDEVIFKNDILQLLKELNAKISKPYPVCASVGVCSAPAESIDFEAALKISDDRMYIMKIGQPNRRKR